LIGWTEYLRELLSSVTIIFFFLLNHFLYTAMRLVSLNQKFRVGGSCQFNVPLCHLHMNNCYWTNWPMELRMGEIDFSSKERKASYWRWHASYTFRLQKSRKYPKQLHRFKYIPTALCPKSTLWP
jgi:hypothetical protein